jgi:hypothetical protein
MRRIETGRCTATGQALKRVATVFVCWRDSLNHGEADAAEKYSGSMTKVILARTDEGVGCERAHPEVAAALAGRTRRQRI